jgi:hypothetical protein
MPFLLVCQNIYFLLVQTKNARFIVSSGHNNVKWKMDILLVRQYICDKRKMLLLLVGQDSFSVK